MKVLINTTPPTNSGGVANHYKGIRKYWSKEVYYNFIGGRRGIPGAIILCIDVIKFIYKLFRINPDVILLNPSLGKTALKRDGLYLRISKKFRKKTIVFFHGWDEEVAAHISQSPNGFVGLYNKSDKILVLAYSFKKQLEKWGISKPIELTTTKVDDDLTKEFDISKKDYGQTVLFLARIEREKGIFIALEAYEEIKKQLPKANMIVAGSGSALKEAKEYAEINNLSDINFTGYLKGEGLIEAFKRSDLYLLPTYGEGMPTSVLEAMAFGIPIISRPVGGLVDFFKNGKMGYLIDSLKPEDFADKGLQILSDSTKLKRISIYNFRYAKDNFYASFVASSLEEHFKSVVTKQL